MSSSTAPNSACSGPTGKKPSSGRKSAVRNCTPNNFDVVDALVNKQPLKNGNVSIFRSRYKERVTNRTWAAEKQFQHEVRFELLPELKKIHGGITKFYVPKDVGGDWFMNFRSLLGVTGRAMSCLVGKSGSTWNNWEAGRSQPREDFLEFDPNVNPYIQKPAKK